MKLQFNPNNSVVIRTGNRYRVRYGEVPIERCRSLKIRIDVWKVSQGSPKALFVLNWCHRGVEWHVWTQCTRKGLKWFYKSMQVHVKPKLGSLTCFWDSCDSFKPINWWSNRLNKWYKTLNSRTRPCRVRRDKSKAVATLPRVWVW